MDIQSLISPDECEKVIKEFSNCNDAKVVSYSTSKFGDNSTGFLGEYLILLIKYHCVSILVSLSSIKSEILSYLIEINVHEFIYIREKSMFKCKWKDSEIVSIP